jgi:hypothetical protein
MDAGGAVPILAGAGAALILRGDTVPGAMSVRRLTDFGLVCTNPALKPWRTPSLTQGV